MALATDARLGPCVMEELRLQGIGDQRPEIRMHPKSDMVKDTKRVLMAAWKEFAGAFPTRFPAQHAEMDVYCGGIAVPLFNLAYPKSDDAIRPTELERLMNEFGGILAGRGIPGLLFLRAEQVDSGMGLQPMIR